MSRRPLWRKLIIPAVALVVGVAAGVKAGVQYARGTYVSRDRKFVEAEIVKDNKK